VDWNGLTRGCNGRRPRKRGSAPLSRWVVNRTSHLDRQERWVRTSFAAARVEQWLVPLVQGLGRLDVRLIGEDERILALSEAQRTTETELLGFDELRTSSYLWVLGAYEVVRTLHQRVQAEGGDAWADRIGDLKRRFARLRMPLAKLVPASAHPTDSAVAYPASHVEDGTAWQLADGVFITRRELSDTLLNLLEEMRDDDPSLPTEEPAG
jgi:hypothetical protein